MNVLNLNFSRIELDQKISNDNLKKSSENIANTFKSILLKDLVKVPEGLGKNLQCELYWGKLIEAIVSNSNIGIFDDFTKNIYEELKTSAQKLSITS